jgi:hypothetical protein
MLKLRKTATLFSLRKFDEEFTVNIPLERALRVLADEHNKAYSSVFFSAELA